MHDDNDQTPTPDEPVINAAALADAMQPRPKLLRSPTTPVAPLTIPAPDPDTSLH